jgi:hypothetical protein
MELLLARLPVVVSPPITELQGHQPASEESG